MDVREHIKVSRLMDAAVAGLMLDGPELDHLVSCDACQDLFEIFRQELQGWDSHPATPEGSTAAGRKVA